MSETMLDRTGVDHVDEGALVRLIDNALEDDERDFVLRHMRDCLACRAQAEELRVLSRGWTRVLEKADELGSARSIESDWSAATTRGEQQVDAADAMPAWPSRRDWSAWTRRRVWLRAAAIVLAAGALAAPPVRALIADTWQRIVSVPRTADEAPVVVDDQPSLTTISFTHASEVFVLSFDAVQMAGEVVIAFDAAATEATARLQGGAEEELLIQPTGLRVVNASASSASYELILPAHVRTVRIRVAGADARTVEAEQVGPELRVRLPVRLPVPVP